MKLYNLKLSALLVALLLSVIILKHNSKKNIVAENLALGEGTKSYYAIDDDSISVHSRYFSEISSFYKGWRVRGKRDVILLLGNSQLHGINQMSSHDKSFPQLLFNYYDNLGYDFLTNSLPNVNLQEQLLIFNELNKVLNIKILLLPVFLDDTREDNIRDHLKDNIKGLNIIESESSSKKKNLNTIQKRVEEYINIILKENFKVWESKPSFSTQIFQFLYNLRNTIFGINPSTIRKIIPRVLDKNIASLEQILKICKTNKISPVIYIPPIRYDIEIPYDLNEYSNFKKNIQNIANNYNAEFYNLEKLIPSEYWGLKESTSINKLLELDFMHFSYGGHLIMYENIIEILKTVNNK